MTGSVFEKLNAIDIMPHTKTKGDGKNAKTYLSWAWAWRLVKEMYPDANYSVVEFDGKPYLYDDLLGYLVKTEVTIKGETISMQLPVLNGANKAMLSSSYTYMVKGYNGGPDTEKTVNKATMMDINTATMRCLTKNIAMFGLGHCLYIKEGIPTDSVVVKPITELQLKRLNNLFNELSKQEADIFNNWLIINNLNKLSDIPKCWFDGACAELNRVKEVNVAC